MTTWSSTCSAGSRIGSRLLARLDELRALGRPLYVSLSRKDFIGAVLAGSWERRAPADEREWGTAAAAALAVSAGAEILRLHDPSALQAVRIAGRIVGAGNGDAG
jgi:dihydropteroate synthase